MSTNQEETVMTQNKSQEETEQQEDFDVEKEFRIALYMEALKREQQTEESKQEELQKVKFILEAGTLKNVLESVNNLVEEVTISVNPTDSENTITIRTMDPSHVALVDVVIVASELREIEGDSVKFGIRVNEIFEQLRSLIPENKQKERVEVEYIQDTEDKERGKLTVKVDGMTTTFKTIEIGSSTTPLPKLNFNAKLNFNEENINALQKYMRVYSKNFEYIRLEAQTTNNILRVFSKGDTGEAQTEIETDIIEVREDSQATYSMDYIKKQWESIKRTSRFVNKNNNSVILGKVEIAFSTKMPLRIRSKLGVESRVDFYLAPRIED